MGHEPVEHALRRRSRALKRLFDIACSASGLLLLWWLIAVGWAVASVDTRRNGFFLQERIGRGGRTFRIVKLRTMRNVPGLRSTATAQGDPRITPTGALLRRLKLDELPQLLNVLAGQMSLVGPRPDICGFADRLEGDDRIILKVRPGITGPATLRFRNEEAILASVPDPEAYSRQVIWPEKVRINRRYVLEWTFAGDLRLIVQTISGRVPEDV
jgi:lipopolysaccharide/colanic/teichoic acid biosynthesis glycosyltransferase